MTKVHHAVRRWWNGLPRNLRVGGMVLVALLAAAAAGIVWAISLFQVGGKGELLEVRVISADPERGVSVRFQGAEGLEVEGITPCEVRLPPGEYRYTAAAPGYRTASGAVHIEGPAPTVQIPPLQRATGMIEVRSNAHVAVLVDGAEVGWAGPDPARWFSFGPFTEGVHLVRAGTPVEEKVVTVTVSSYAAARVEFLWGSRLVVVVEPADVLSASVSVDGFPYSEPMDFSASHLAVRPYVEVEVEAPGYAVWSDTVFLSPGAVTTATAHLSATGVLSATEPVSTSALVEEVLSAFRRCWEVVRDAWARLDGGTLPDVLTGEALELEQYSIEVARATLTSILVTATFPITPTVQVEESGAATVTVPLFIWQSKYIPRGHEPYFDRYELSGTFLFLRGDDGIWRMAKEYLTEISSWNSLSTPTPGAGRGGGGGGSGGGRPAPADRGLVAQLILESINCNRPGNPARWDQELADLLARYVDNQAGLDEALAGLRPRGWMIGSWGIWLSYSSGNAWYGEFAYDWENYVGRACETHYADAWASKTLPYSSIGIAIGEPRWDGYIWKAWVLIAGR